jgi:hypothetical protein
MMIEAQEHEVLFVGILVVLIEMGYLPFLNLINSRKPEAHAAPPAAFQKYGILHIVRYRLAAHGSLPALQESQKHLQRTKPNEPGRGDAGPRVLHAYSSDERIAILSQNPHRTTTNAA